MNPHNIQLPQSTLIWIGPAFPCDCGDLNPDYHHACVRTILGSNVPAGRVYYCECIRCERMNGDIGRHYFVSDRQHHTTCPDCRKDDHPKP